ncbi:hypothetical protein [Rhizobium leguminosarum]|uniref:hypothetical protein n=1 Tax=Rhizobium leguminosarum TaxID=384 RepID=UPI000B925675|nr:hypothetical protein [Rhizobium leguminosarum]ASS55868.1 hypothetical protein CHR56_15570 [Rhizobium leguminosarum bv. viciae]
MSNSDTDQRAFDAAWKICSAWDGKITKPVLRKAIDAALKEIAQPVADSDTIEALEACEQYFDNRADADCDQDGFIPNEEMIILSKVQSALEPLRVTKTVMPLPVEEADRFRRMVERRDEFIIANGLWDAFKEASRGED